MSGLALLVLVAACANLASLFAARAADRSRELAIRVALGASQWRLVRQVMTEAVVLAMVGGGAGLMGAGLLLRALQPIGNRPYGQMAISVDARVYLVALALTVVSALLLGMIPARQVRQTSPLQAMKSGRRMRRRGAGWRRGICYWAHRLPSACFWSRLRWSRCAAWCGCCTLRSDFSRKA